MRAALCAALMFSLATPISAQQGAPAAVPVGTVVAERKPISKALAYVGRVEAVNRVQIVARVKGFLEEILFNEGDIIQKGFRSRIVQLVK